MEEKITQKAMAVEENGVHAKVITPEDGGHYFFGYYDMRQYLDRLRYLYTLHRYNYGDIYGNGQKRWRKHQLNRGGNTSLQWKKQQLSRGVVA